MNGRWILAAALGIGLFGCSHNHGEKPEAKSKHEEIEPGETKVKLDDTPASVKQTIQKETANGELEDISKISRNGKTIYETDYSKNGQKWELWVGEDGSVIHNFKEGGAEEKAAEKAAEKEEKGEAKAEAKEAGWRQDFNTDKSTFKPTGNNQWLTIQPGKVQKMKSGIDSLTVTILPETKVIDGVTCGVLEERETKDGKLIEVSRNFFATDSATNDVYYFGEDVDNYKDGQITSHESAWHAGENGAKFGLMIPGQPKQGDKFYQEIAPKVAMDRVEIVSTDETVKVPAGTFQHCLHLKETTPIEADVSHKYYAPGVGMIKDDEFELAEKP